MVDISLIIGVVILAAAGVAWFFLFRKPNLAALAKKDPEKFFQALALFRGFSAEDIKDLRTILEKVNLPSGSYLFKEGEKGSSLFIVAQGALKIIKSIDGKPQVLKVAKVGDILGEMALLSGQPRTAAAVADAETVVFKLERNRFSDLKAKSQALLDVIWSAYSWNLLDNHLVAAKRSGLWQMIPNKSELPIWYAKQMSATVDMDQKLPVPQGAGMFFVVTGVVSVDGQEWPAPKLFEVRPDSDIKTIRSSRVMWFAPHPRFRR